MLRKLYKHEFAYYYPYAPLLWAAIILTGLVTGLFLRFLEPLADEVNEAAYISFQFIITSSFLLFALTIIATFILLLVLEVIRFYRSMVSKEAYLTYSLPFSTMTHFHCKLFVSVIMTLVTGFVVALSFLFMSLLLGTDLFDLLADLCSLPSYLSPLSLICLILLIPLSCFTSILEFYFCLSLGQRFKNPVLASVLIYVGLSFLMECTSCNLIPSFFLSVSTFYDEEWYLLFQVIYLAVQGLVYYFVSRNSLTKHLNL